MRVGILSQYYPPEMGAPQARLSRLAARTERGHEVVVLTALPNYPQGRIFSRATAARSYVSGTEKSR